MTGAVIRTDGWATHHIWDASETVRQLYRQRARDEAEEMTSAAQAAELLAPLVEDDVDSLFCTPALPDPAMFPPSICLVPDNEDDDDDEDDGRDAV